MMSDASEMLAAALEQMDGIIAGSKAMDYSNGLFDCQSPNSPFLGSLRALHLLEDLRAALELMDTDERDSLRCQIPDTTAEGLVEWLQGRMVTINGHGSMEPVHQERLTRLESDKECLVLQISVLTDQVEVQGEKIRDLDMCLTDHKAKLNSTEELLQQELLTRSTLETQKLELMTEVSSLKLRLTSVERECRDSESLYQEVTALRLRLTDMENERLLCEKQLISTKEELQTMQRLLGEREGDLSRLQNETSVGITSQDRIHEGEKEAEMLKIKRVLQSLMSANDEKEQRIEELQESLTHYKTVQDMVKDKLNEDDYDDIPDYPSIHVAMDLEHTALGLEGETGRRSAERQSIPCIAVLSEMNELDRERQLQAQTAQRSLDFPHSDGPALRHNTTNQSNTKEEPIFLSASPGKPNTTGDESFGTKKARASFGRGFFKMRGGKRTTSSPNLAETEHKDIEHLDLAGAPSKKSQGSTNTIPCTPEAKKKSRGFKKFFGRLRRSQSTSFNTEEPTETEFRRGGVRATAGPRLGWSQDPSQLNASPAAVPFAQWSKAQVWTWLHEQGLGLHVAPGQGWIHSGHTLLQVSQQDLEKDLGLKQPLHKKKLLLALQSLSSEEDELKGKLDHNWLTRWLDDIGLPQYKSQFDEGRVDGRMLHYMTVEELLSLKVGSVLHHLSIKRAIQVLRLNHFEPNCLRRRPSDENNITPAEISQWTNHRVMEWLRSVDLAEYAPNLRGSGVHGGLMVLEPRFNVESLALLLNIPPNKTLLRRHLATHFHLLIGPEAQRLKQTCLENPDYTVLTATARVKWLHQPVKCVLSDLTPSDRIRSILLLNCGDIKGGHTRPRRLSFGVLGTLRRKRQEESEEYVCPMDVEMPKSDCFQRGWRMYDDELNQLEQMQDSEVTVRQIEALSEGIDNLTSMLKEEEFFQESSTCSPVLNMTDLHSAVCTRAEQPLHWQLSEGCEREQTVPSSITSPELPSPHIIQNI